MILLTTTTDFVELVTGAAQSTDYVASFVDITTTTFTPGSSQGNISTATTTTLVAAPAASTQRQVKYITVINRGTSNQTVTAAKSSAATVYDFTNAIVLAPGESLVYTDVTGWQVFDLYGRLKTASGTGSNPTALVKLTPVNGIASTFMTSDSAPALDQTIAPTWTGAHTFSARVTANLGLTVAGGTFISRGITDASTATAVTLAVAGNVTIAAPTSGVTLTMAGVAASTTVNLNSAAITSVPDLQINRTASTANIIQEGANVTLYDISVPTVSVLQHSGGQTELWQYNGGWNQILHVATTRGVTIAAPASGNALTVMGIGGATSPINSITGPQGTAIQFSDGTNTGGFFGFDISHNCQLGSLSGTYGIALYTGANRLVISGAGNVTINAPTSGAALAISAVAGGWGTVITGSPTVGQSYGLGVLAGTNSSDTAFIVYNQSASVSFLSIHGDGSGYLGPTALNRLSWTVGGNFAIAAPVSGDTLTLAPSVSTGALIATSAALTTGAGAATGTLSNAPAAGNPTKWIKINDFGTIRSIPAW